ncbi:type IV conjugative transfer system protein TraL [Providencia sp. wls1919]|nr:type IV conjugative transfer system protein TraL [Providencia sp. wls1919]
MTEESELKKYYFPKTLREEDRWFGLPVDEFVPVLISIGWGLWAGKHLIALVAAVFFFFAIRHLKKGRGSKWLRDLLYWYLPTMYLQGIFKKIPHSCFRQWTK